MFFFSSSRPSLASHNSIYTASLLKRFAEECMYFSSANPSLVERGWMTATRRTPQSQHNCSVSGWRSLYGPTRFNRSPRDESVSGRCSLYGPTRFDRSPREESSASSCLERDERFAGASRLIRCTCHSLGHLATCH